MHENEVLDFAGEEKSEKLDKAFFAIIHAGTDILKGPGHSQSESFCLLMEGEFLNNEVRFLICGRNPHIADNLAIFLGWR